jgi:predicted nucleotidyltransferase
MNTQEILDRLRDNERALRARGVTHAALFGSRARGEGRPDSDIDIMVDIAPDANIDLFGYVGIKHCVEDLFPLRVDVVSRQSMKPYVRPHAERDAIYAF